MYKGLLNEYASYLPVNENTPDVSLMEGNTPLIPLLNISKQLGIQLYGKYEGANPTGSFKDRGMVMAVAKAKEEGSEAIICASTGNTSASAAAYAARLGMKCIIVIPEGKIAHGKLAQAVAYGAEIISIEGNFDDALKAVRNIAAEEPITLVNSVNPYRIEGQKTAAFEICDQLQRAPDVLAIPVGNAGNITAYWKGFCEYEKEKGYKKPRIHGFEAEGAAAIVKGHVIEEPETIATAIRIGNPASWSYAVEAAEQSHGEIDMVSDEEILHAYRLLAKSEGVFAEPGSNASLAGVMKHVQSGKIKKGETVVAVLTGNGLKDPDIAISSNTLDIASVSNNIEQIKEHIKGVIMS
ncbi:threonine synthase [Bacillus paranthracis]|uniref:Threonine synthase n=2 Tax=Bacillus cereus group TaxID=86661 RepID=A0A5M9H1B7_9BACI|nr:MULTISPECIES: threonine synthase [Bacillus]ACJ81037.1 threonine synthase [Bacillus cereus AH187]EDZ55734.1 threonine synthase [Bacillus cereus H3081.97]EJP88294.1 threonine synthase [Bacillus cereus IS075]EJQ08147.1 threonine synthase [Bacillus cereus AND1407]EJR14653.1 threonine synthase [Bacillus cereus MSX-A12]EOO83883.1 threonine synthase [Bacillus cereus IS845/00]EOO95255.1 threonine synthase [Bacillus cereus IS195]KFK73324.1 threonine synthase [Bacillus cereus]MRA59655.1 threonine